MSIDGFDSSGFAGHGDGEVDDAKAMLLQSQAIAALSALATGNTPVVMAQMDDLWSKSCMEKIFCMSTWVLVARQAASATGIALNIAVGDGEGNLNTDLSDSEKISESFVNVLLSVEAGEDFSPRIGVAWDAMHEYLHEATEVDARTAFACVLGMCTDGAMRCMEYANSGILPEEGVISL